MDRLIFLDVETTGLGDDARIVQLAWAHLAKRRSIYVRPPVPISYEAMATHHITEAMVEDCPAFEGSEEQAELVDAFLHGGVLVAHNAEYDARVLANEGIEVGHAICTLKLARHVFPEYPSHALHYLRYREGG